MFLPVLNDAPIAFENVGTATFKRRRRIVFMDITGSRQ